VNRMSVLNQEMQHRLINATPYEITYIWHQWIRYGLMFSVRNRQELAREYFTKAIELGELILSKEVSTSHLSHYFLSVIFLYKNYYACYLDEQADETLVSAFRYVCALNISCDDDYIYTCCQSLLTPAKHNFFVKAYIKEFGSLTKENQAIYETHRGSISLKALLQQ